MTPLTDGSTPGRSICAFVQVRRRRWCARGPAVQRFDSPAGARRRRPPTAAFVHARSCGTLRSWSERGGRQSWAWYSRPQDGLDAEPVAAADGDGDYRSRRRRPQSRSNRQNARRWRGACSHAVVRLLLAATSSESRSASGVPELIHACRPPRSRGSSQIGDARYRASTRRCRVARRIARDLGAGKVAGRKRSTTAACVVAAAAPDQQPELRTGLGATSAGAATEERVLAPWS